MADRTDIFGSTDWQRDAAVRNVAVADGPSKTAKALVVTMAPGELAVVAIAELDTQGDIVPAWKGQSFQYDASGNLISSTVTDGTTVWMRSYTFDQGHQTQDTGWVKQ